MPMPPAQQLAVYVPDSVKLHAYPPGFRSKPAQLRAQALAYVVAGSGCLQVDDIRCELRPGRCLLLAPAMRVRLSASDDGGGVKLYYVHYVRLDRSGAALPQPASGPTSDLAAAALYVDVPSKAAAISALRRLAVLRDSGEAPDAGETLRRQHEFSAFLLSLLEGRRPKDEAASIEPIRRAMEYMDRHYADSIEPGLLPRLAGMTPSSFSRAFKRETGRSPGTYLTELRVAKAKELMSQPGITVKELARHVGFQDELYFSRVFKKTEGLPPTIYWKRRSRERIAVVSGLLLQDHLLALGVPPVAAPAYPNYFHTPSGFPSYLNSRLSGTLPLNAARTVGTKEVLRAEPDLVLKSSFRLNPNDERWSRFDADTVFIEHAGQWEHFQRLVGSLLGKEREAEAVIGRISALEREAAERLRGAGRSGTWAIIRALPGDCRVYGASGHSFVELFYDRLAFRPHPRLDHAAYRSAGFETLLASDPDHILILWSEREEIQRLAADPRWPQLRAVRLGRVHAPDSREWDSWGPYGREFMLQRLTRYFQRRLSLRG